jgi:hypothetical protein
MKVSKDLNALKDIAEQRDYGMPSALVDLSGVGTLYYMGADKAQIDRLSKISDIKDPILNKHVQEYLTSAQRSLAARAGYLTSASVAATGACIESLWLMGLGGIAAALFAALFTARAGLNNVDREVLEEIRLTTGDI